MSRRTALVTGATSGIGLEVARRLRSDGFDLVITGRDAARGATARAELGDRTVFVALDLTADEAAATLTEAALTAFGRLDVVVNNAAEDHSAALVDVSVDEIRHLFEVNTIAAMAVLKESAKRMPEGGTIINVGSRLASVGVPTMTIYSAAKGGLKAFTTAAAVELAERNIRVNSVAPGMTRTPLYEAWLDTMPDPAQTEREVVAGIPLGRLAIPADVAAVISFLASEEASYLTGVDIAIDGGYTAR